MLQSFLNGLSQLGRQWQSVGNPDDVNDQEDNSSIASDWSIMRVESDTEQDAGPSSPSLVNVPSDGPESLANSLDSPVHVNLDEPEDQARRETGGQQLDQRAASGRVRRRHAAFTSDGLSSLRQQFASPDPIDSRRAASRWNTAAHIRKSHHSTLSVDNQRTKCLRRGAQVSSGFQRKQVRLASGGQLPQGRRAVCKA